MAPLSHSFSILAFPKPTDGWREPSQQCSLLWKASLMIKSCLAVLKSACVGIYSFYISTTIVFSMSTTSLNHSMRSHHFPMIGMQNNASSFSTAMLLLKQGRYTKHWASQVTLSCGQHQRSNSLYLMFIPTTYKRSVLPFAKSGL